MVYRLAGVLLVVALASAGGAEPFARVPSNRRSPRPRLVVGSWCSVAELTHSNCYARGTNALIGNRHHHLLAALATVAVAPNLHVHATPALVGFVTAGIVPDLPVQPVPVALNTRPIDAHASFFTPAPHQPSLPSAAYFPEIPFVRTSSTECLCRSSPVVVWGTRDADKNCWCVVRKGHGTGHRALFAWAVHAVLSQARIGRRTRQLVGTSRAGHRPLDVSAFGMCLRSAHREEVEP